MIPLCRSLSRISQARTYTPEVGFPVNNARASGAEGAVRDRRATITRITRSWSGPKPLPTRTLSTIARRGRGGQRSAEGQKETPSRERVDMFRCICRHALYRVHTRARSLRTLEVTRRSIEWRRTRQPESGDVFQFGEGVSKCFIT